MNKKLLVGLYIQHQTQSLKDWITEQTDEVNFEEIIEVRCVIDGQTRDFTMAEFKNLLGFK